MLKPWFFLAVGLNLFISSCSFWAEKSSTAAIPGTIDEAVSSSFRSRTNKKRDDDQHPKETLEFFGLKPNMTVIEISPAGGYYTEILAPYLVREGEYVMAVPRLPPNPPKPLVDNENALQEILLRRPDVQARSKFMPFEPLSQRNRSRKEFADMVVTFSSVHNWVARDMTKASFKFCYDVLKPGGILGIVQHRISPQKKKVPKSGYMTEAEVVAFAKQAGFKLVEKSEINANPKDTAQWPEGVWTLPPTFRLGDKDRRVYEGIGESDRMTLKFVRP